MAPVTPARLRFAAQDSDSPFSSRIVRIAIGKEQVIFNIHQEKLRKTAFFHIHGGLPSNAEKLRRAKQFEAAPGSPDDDDKTVKGEEGDTAVSELEVSATQYSEDTEDIDPATFASNLPDYYVVDRFHIPRAFKVITQWLYNEPPAAIQTRNHCQALLQAYVLARDYKIFALQNVIIERFRTYHANTNVSFDDLTWIANRYEEDPKNCALTAYLLAQVVFEISNRGFDDFAAGNGYLTTFIGHGQLPILRVALFKAIASDAQIRAAKGPIGDPAEGENLWLVYEDGEGAGAMHRERV